MARSPQARTFITLGLLAACGLSAAWYLSLAPDSTEPGGVQATPADRGEDAGDVAVELDELAALQGSASRTATVSPVPPATRRIVAAASPSRDPWVLHGSVVDDRGRPVSGALVGLTELQRGAPKSSGERSHVLADARGSFEFPVPAWARGGSHLLCARSEGWQPDSRVTTIDLALTQQALRMTLGAGHSLSGVVLAGGAPVPGASVSFDAAYGTPGVFGMGREAWWVEGQLFEKHGSTTTDAQGRFEVHGLGPYGHSLRIYPPMDFFTLGHFTFLDVKTGDRVFDVSRATLSITVDGPGNSTEKPEVQVSIDSHTCRTVATPKPLLFHVAPEEQVSLEVSHPYAETVRRTFKHLAVNQTEHVHVSLEWVERPSLTVHLPGATAAGVRGISLHLWRLGSYQLTQLKVTPGPGLDTFRVKAVPCAPGRVQLLLGPHDHGVGAYVQPEDQCISLPASGDVDVSFSLELLGRCELQLESPLMSDWGATSKLISPGGTTLRTLDFQMEQGGEWMMMEEGEPDFGLGGPEHASPAGRKLYPAGTYTYRVKSSEHRPWSQQVTVRPGKTTRVTAVLVPL